MDGTKKFHKLGDTPHLHVGDLIWKILNEKKITRTELARKIGVRLPVVTEYLNKQSLQMGILWKISIALDYNFLADVIDGLPESVFKKSKASFLKKAEAQQQEMETLRNELNIYKEIVKKS